MSTDKVDGDDGWKGSYEDVTIDESPFTDTAETLPMA